MRNPLLAALAAFVLSTIPFPALADVKAGIDAWENGDYPAAIAAWRPLAEQGDADAQFNLGQAYRFGKGVPVDLTLAEHWYRRAADQGHSQAEDNLGLVLFQNGKQKDALPLIRQAADRGNARAQFVLGTILFNGDLAARDRAAAYAYTMRAANGGLQRAQLRLMEMERYLSAEERRKGQSLAQQMDSSSSPADRPSQTASAPAPALLAARSQALPPPAAPPTAPPTTPMPAPEGSTQNVDAVPPQIRAPKSPSPGPAISASIAPAQTPPIHMLPVPDPLPLPLPSPSPLPSPARGTPAPGWRVQFGAFSNPKGARALWQTLQPRLADLGRLLPQFEKAGPVTRLRAGPFANQAAAQRLCHQAKAIGQSCLVVVP